MSREVEMDKRVENMIREWQTSAERQPYLQERIVAFVRSEIRRELESLRASEYIYTDIKRRLDALMDNGPDLSGHDPSWVRPTQATPGDPARPTDPRLADDRVVIRLDLQERDPARPTDPRLADAEVLERAAAVLDRNSPTEAGALRARANLYRSEAAAAARDWADEVASTYRDKAPEWDLDCLLRARFGPLVEMAYRIEEGERASDIEARAALRALRGGRA